MAGLNIERGIFPTLMKNFEAAAKGSDKKVDALSGPEVKKVLSKGIAAIKDNFDGADSEAGLAGMRNALAKTFAAADKNWPVSKSGYDVARKILGAKLDGKGGEMAKVEAQIRSAVHGPTFRPYGGGGGGAVGGGGGVGS